MARLVRRTVGETRAVCRSRRNRPHGVRPIEVAGGAAGRHCAWSVPLADCKPADTGVGLSVEVVAVRDPKIAVAWARPDREHDVLADARPGDVAHGSEDTAVAGLPLAELADALPIATSDQVGTDGRVELDVGLLAAAA